MPPAFSVVIPLFNKEKYIARCILSVIKQSYPASEIIIVNDGSTDNSLHEAKKISDPRITVFDRKNGGVSSARNFGMAQCKYEYIALLDADDEWDAAFLKIMGALTQKFPEAGLYYAAHTNEIHQAGKKRVLTTVIPSLSLGYEGYVDIFDYNTEQGPWSSAVVIRKGFLEKTGLFDQNLTKGEDIDMWIRFALNGLVATHNASLSICHQEDENSAMRKTCPPQRCLVSNLGRYEAVARKNPQLYKYLLHMRIAHICNFLGGRPCEMADVHREIENLDLSLLPPVWTWIRYSPRCLRWLIFKSHLHGIRVLNRLTSLIRR